MGDKSPKNNSKAKKLKANKKGRASATPAPQPDLRPGTVARVGRERP
jgi:hypothetical protein